MTLDSLPVFLRLAGRPVILIGEGEAAAARRRLLERAGAVIVGEDGRPLPRRPGEFSADPIMGFIAADDPDAAAARLKARGILVNVADRPDLCDFTLPAIVDRSPVIVAVGTGGASAGLAAAVRQRLEAILPAGLGRLAGALHGARDAIRARLPDAADRRRSLGEALAPGGALDPFGPEPDVDAWLAAGGQRQEAATEVRIALASPDPDDLTLRQARLLAQADRVIHGADVPLAILNRARADAARIASASSPVAPSKGLTVIVEMAR